MKLALVNPSNPETDISPPLGLAYIASYVKQQLPNVEIKIFDGATGTNIEQSIFNFQPNIVGATATTTQILNAYNLLAVLRQNRPDILTVIGGVHASALPNEASKHADCVVIGDGEKAMVQIINLYQSHLPIPKILYGEEITDLDSLPMPAYDLLNIPSYINQRIPYLRKLGLPLARLVTSRGCNYRCPFCYNSTRETKVRYRSAEKIIEEIQYFVKNWHIKYVWFHDDEFLGNKKRLNEFCVLLEKTGLNKQIKWGCMARADSLTDETVNLITFYGCVQVYIGVESATPKTLAYLKCSTLSIQQIEKALDVCKKHGLATFCNFIFGSPNETLSDMKQTWNWIASHLNKICGFGYLPLTPYPGTRVFNEWHNKPEQIDYSQFSQAFTLEQRYTVADAVSMKDFKKFMVLIERLTWFHYQLTSGSSYLHLMKLKTFWWILLVHPRFFRQVSKAKNLTNSYTAEKTT